MPPKLPTGATMDTILAALDYDTVNWEHLWRPDATEDDLYYKIFMIWWNAQDTDIKNMVGMHDFYLNVIDLMNWREKNPTEAAQIDALLRNTFEGYGTMQARLNQQLYREGSTTDGSLRFYFEPAPEKDADTLRNNRRKARTPKKDTTITNTNTNQSPVLVSVVQKTPPNIQPFVLPTNVLERPQYIRDYRVSTENALVAAGYADPEEKYFQLKDKGGQAMVDIDARENPSTVNTALDNVYTVLWKKIHHCHPEEVNKHYARYHLTRITRHTGETLGDLHMRLEKQGRLCDYGTQLKENLLDKHIALATDHTMLMRTFTQSAVTLDWFLKEAQARETASVTLKAMAPSDPSESKVLKASQENSCGFCGREYHDRDDCPAQGDTCLGCGLKNHWRAVCRRRLEKKDKHGTSTHRDSRKPSYRSKHQAKKGGQRDQPGTSSKQRRYKDGETKKQTKYHGKRRVRKTEASETDESDSESEDDSATRQSRNTEQSEDSSSASEAGTESSFE